jgi:flagellar motor component MotA
LPALTPEEEAFTKYVAELVTLTSLSPDEIQDFLTCTPEEQIAIAESYRNTDWVKSPDTFGKVLAVLGVIGTIAGVVAGVAGAATAIDALKLL